MSNFSEQLRSIIKKEDISVYNLAKQLDCDRTWLQKVLTGERKMSFELFVSMCNILENEVGGNILKQLYESFCESHFGDNEYEALRYMKQRFQMMRELELYLKTIKETGFNIEQYCVKYHLNDNQKMLVHKLYEKLRQELEQAKKEQRVPILYFNLPAEWQYLKDLLIIFIAVNELKGNVDFKYIVNSVGKKNVELAMVEQYLTATEFATYGYNTFEGDIILAQEEGLLAFSYCVMIGEQVIMLSEDGMLNVECDEVELCKQMVKRFVELCGQKKSFLAVVDPNTYSGMLLSGKIDIENCIEIGNNLCVAAFYTKDILEQIVPKAYPERNFVIETVNMYYEKSRASNLSLCFTIDSIKHFLETNESKQEGQYFNLEFTYEIKIQLLKAIYQQYSTVDKDIRMLQTEHFRYLSDLHIFAWDERIIGTTGFWYVGEHKIDAMSFVHNPAVAKLIWKFDLYMRNSYLYLDKPSSLQVLNNLINAFEL